MDKEDVFLRLGDLIFDQDVAIGTIATAIEINGIYTWDRFGRRRLFAAQTSEAQSALDNLSALYAVDNFRAEEEWREPFSEHGGSNFGWPSTQIPDFRLIASTVSTSRSEVRSKQAVQKTENATLGIIGGLLLFIQGGLGNQQHPDFHSEDALAGFLEKKLEGYAGLSRRNMKDKFAKAKLLLAPERS